MFFLTEKKTHLNSACDSHRLNVVYSSYIHQVSGQRLAYKFVKPPFGKSSDSTPKEIPAKTNVVTAPATVVEETKKAELAGEGSGNKEMLAIPTAPCVRTSSVTLPQTTVTSNSMGFRIIQAPLVSPNHMTYPVSFYPYVVPYVIPACRQIEIIKS